jgi:uncharacterized protein (DUF1330 family)
MAVHAQEAKTPPAYLIAETDVTDRAAFQKYAEKVPETLARGPKRLRRHFEL